MSTTGFEKFRLNVTGADEDVPRLLLAYGRACGGEVAFVMRPRDNTALLIHQVKKPPRRCGGPTWASRPRTRPNSTPTRPPRWRS